MKLIYGKSVSSLEVLKTSISHFYPMKGTIAEAFGVPISEGAAIKRTVGGVEHEPIRAVTFKRWTFIVGKNGK
jgi:hypothetical protein